jgi:hypothetical protein
MFMLVTIPLYLVSLSREAKTSSSKAFPIKEKVAYLQIMSANAVAIAFILPAVSVIC